MDDGAARTRVLVTVLCLAVLGAGAAAVRSVLETGCPAPRVVGLPLERADAALREAGVVPDSVSVRRVAGDAAEGTVTEQRSTTCSQPVSLVVADGGPAVGIEEVPLPYRDLVRDGSAPVRLLRTPEGPAYKSDDLLVGECPAVRAARPEIGDDVFEVRCRPALEQRLLQTVVRLSRTWWGDAPSGSGGVRSGSGETYFSTAWGARVRRDGWELRVDVAFSGTDATPRTGEGGDEGADEGGERGDGVEATYAAADLQAVEDAALIVAKGSGNTSVEVLLVPDTGTTSPPPVDLTQLRRLAADVLEVAAGA